MGPGEVSDEMVRDVVEKVKSASQRGNLVLESNGDGSIRFVPPYTKDEADYREPNTPGFAPSHERCDECAHYIPGGGCHLVRGYINPAAYCGEFFADVTVAAHEHESGAEINCMKFGADFDWEGEDIDNFVLELRERLQHEKRAEE